MRERVIEVSYPCAGIWPCGLWTLAAWRGLIYAASSASAVSGRVASGISPYGVSSFCTLGWGRRVTRVEWSSIYPVLVLQPVTGAPRVTWGGWPQPSTLQVYACPLVFSPSGPFRPLNHGGKAVANAPGGCVDSAEQGWD